MEAAIFPPEILLRILSWCDKPTLKTFRQSCQALNYEITPLLFREIVVVPYLSSFEGVTKLSFNPLIRDSVQRIRYEVNCLFVPESSEEYPDLETEQLVYRKQFGHVEQRYPGFVDYLMQLQTEAFPPPEPEEIQDSLYVSSNGWIMSTGGTETNMLSYLPYFFPLLREMSLTSRGWSPDEGSVDMVKEPPRPLPYFYEKWFKTHKLDPEAPDLDLSSMYFSNGGPEVVSYRAQCLLLALCNHDQKQLHVRVGGLLGRTFTYQYSDEITQIRNQDCLRNCRSLELIFHKKEEFYELGEKYGGLGCFLARNRQMQNLKLYFHDPGEGPQRLLQQMVARKRCPPLKSLTLGRLVLSGATLMDVLKCFAPTLEYLKLDTIRLRSHTQRANEHNDWIVVLKTLAQDFNLERFELEGAIQGDRQEWTICSREQLHNKWRRRTSSMNLSRPKLLASLSFRNEEIGPESADRLVLQPGTNDTVLFDEENCLIARVRNYVTKNGEYPKELVEYEAIARSNLLESRSGRARMVGDYSLTMMVTI